MDKIFAYISDVFRSKSLRKKILFTIGILVIYRILVVLPVPFVDINTLMSLIGETKSNGGGLEYLAMLMGGTLERFSIIAVGLVPFINASIIMQLLTAVVPHLEELQEQGETGTIRIQQYTRWACVPLAFLQSIGMVYFINNMFSTAPLISTNSTIILLLSAFALTVGTVMLIYLGETITEKGITNGVSLIIFASIVSGISGQILGSIQGTNEMLGLLIFMIIVVLILVILSVLLIRTKKEIPIVYARHGKVEETAILPIPLNPVGMIPIIFAMAFTSFPYLLSQLATKMHIVPWASNASKFIETHFNIYSNNPGILAILIYFVFIVVFTFFYTLIVFYPEKMADNIQKRGGFIPGIRPGEETAKYLNKILMHLCLWGGLGLGLIGIYSYVLSYIPFVQNIAMSVGSIPVIVSGAGVIIIVGVVQDLIGKIDAELLMEKYEKI